MTFPLGLPLFLQPGPKGKEGFPSIAKPHSIRIRFYTSQICIPSSPTYAAGHFPWLSLTLPVFPKEVRWCGPFLLIWAEGCPPSDHPRPKVLLSCGHAMVGLIFLTPCVGETIAADTGAGRVQYDFHPLGSHLARFPIWSSGTFALEFTCRLEAG